MPFCARWIGKPGPGGGRAVLNVARNVDSTKGAVNHAGVHSIRVVRINGETYDRMNEVMQGQPVRASIG